MDAERSTIAAPNSTMRAMVFDKYGAAEDVFVSKEVPVPQVGEGQILIRNHAVAVNPIDYKVRKGLLDPDNKGPEGGNKIVGWDAAGEVVALGAGVQFAIGERVWYAGDLTKSGTYAEYTVIDHRLVGRMPKSISFEDAAALPLTFQTASEAFVEQMGAKFVENPREKYALIYNGAGGLGSAGIQVAKSLGLTVVATASRLETQEFVRKMGADFVINHAVSDLNEEIKQKLGENFPGFSYILNAHENKNLGQLVKSLGNDGKIALTWKTTAEELAQMDQDDLWFNRKSIVYTLMFSRALYNAAPEKVGRLLSELAQKVDQKVIQTTRVTTFDDLFSGDLVKAHELQETGKAMGKIVLSVPQDTVQERPSSHDMDAKRRRIA